ncbi:MAG: trypsin-like peptidase domain-containing protein [Clostridia bacterium]|nr:trypsin-like peptidase domain-containing protein [Clostridia bacterium]
MDDYNNFYPYNSNDNESQRLDSSDSADTRTEANFGETPGSAAQGTGNGGYSYQNQPYGNAYNSGYNDYRQSLYNGYPYASQPVKPKKIKKERPFAKKLGRVAAIAAVFGIVTGVCFQGAAGITKKITGDTAAYGSTQAVITTALPGKDDAYDVSEVVENVMPALVAIDVRVISTIQNPFSFFGSRSYQQEQSGSGSGIIISRTDNHLYIVTNNHVVEDATTITVTFDNGKSVEATVKGTDADADLAVVEIPVANIDNETLSAIKVAVMGDSDTLQLGEPAIAIGNALGYGQSVTVGHISALARKVQLTDKTMTLVQTDAAINPGNSGGALLNSKGEVIGINSVKYSSTDVEGIGYAIPISDAIPIINALVSGTALPESKQAYLGISGADVTEQYQLRFGLPAGVYIDDVTAGSPAEKAGIKPYDIITEFDGETVTSMDDLTSIIESKVAGDQVSLTVKRSQNNAYVEVQLTATLDSVSNRPETKTEQDQNSYYNYGNSLFDFFG